jgi:hypothetical protein
MGSEVRARGGVVVQRLDAGEAAALPVIDRRGRAEGGAQWQQVATGGIVVRGAVGSVPAWVGDEALAQLGYLPVPIAIQEQVHRLTERYLAAVGVKDDATATQPAMADDKGVTHG